MQTRVARRDTIACMPAMLSDVELLRRLVAFDSTSFRSNLPMADFVCNYLDDPRAEIVRNFKDEGTKVNVGVRVPGESTANGTEGLVLSGHFDVVPATEPDWQSDPFVLQETENTFFARGVCDMKGFLALAINAAKRSLDRRLKHPLVLLLTCDEELGTVGAQHFARTWDHPFELPRRAIIGEPTTWRVARLHKGHLRMRVVFRGQSAHSGYPHLGINAIEPAGRVITALAELRRELATRRTPSSDHFPDTPYVALNLATIEGGTATNIVPDRCELHFGIRLLPESDSSEVERTVRDCIVSLGDLGDHDVEVVERSPALLTAENTVLHRTVCDLVNQRHTLGMAYVTDAGVFQRMGMECVVFGPGDIAVAHKANESLPKEQLVRGNELVDSLIRTFCDD